MRLRFARHQGERRDEWGAPVAGGPSPQAGFRHTLKAVALTCSNSGCVGPWTPPTQTTKSGGINGRVEERGVKWRGGRVGDSASPTREDFDFSRISVRCSQFLPPLGILTIISVWFCSSVCLVHFFFFFLYLNLYLLFRLLLNLSVISKRKKNCQKKQQKHQVS